jgi:hypothetical protein
MRHDGQGNGTRLGRWQKRVLHTPLESILVGWNAKGADHCRSSGDRCCENGTEHSQGITVLADCTKSFLPAMNPRRTSFSLPSLSPSLPGQRIRARGSSVQKGSSRLLLLVTLVDHERCVINLSKSPLLAHTWRHWGMGCCSSSSGKRFGSEDHKRQIINHFLPPGEQHAARFTYRCVFATRVACCPLPSFHQSRTVFVV